MYQRIARERQPQNAVAVTRQAPQPDHYVANAIGKATLVPHVAPHLGPADVRAAAIETAHRQIRAIRVVLFPAFIKALRTKANQIELVNAAIQLRHMLRCANEQVCDLEKAAIHRDPMLQFLRKEVDTLVARSRRLGLYHGREHLIPRGHEDPVKPTAPAIKRNAEPTKHKHHAAEPNPFASLAPASIRRRRAAHGISQHRVRMHRQGAPK